MRENSINLSWERARDVVNRNRGRPTPPRPRPPRRPAAPRLTLYGGGGTNQRASSPFRFEAPDARLTPRAPRALIGCARRRSGREGGAAEGKGGGEVLARDSPSPACAPALPGRSASFLPSSARLVFRARRALRSAGVPRAVTGGRGRQSAGGRVPAPGLRRRIGGARGPGWEAGLLRGRGGGGAAPSQQPASAERAARRWVRRAAAAGGGGRRAEAEPLIPFGRGRNKRSRTPGSDGAGPGASVQVKRRRPAGPRG
ncbi:translation initiation factor IF-2-like [Lutra lutra]|uniref:translation initiation factor IF-2-like n=1 Tax=Lutra lutra TaxID=9657 RepID=UPI001FD051A7|nr:translation initiation factor IF-2-like [Lutra lutra]